MCSFHDDRNAVNTNAIWCSCLSGCARCRAKYGESAFLEVYQKLYEAPDPATVLTSALVMYAQLNTSMWMPLTLLSYCSAEALYHKQLCTTNSSAPCCVWSLPPNKTSAPVLHAVPQASLAPKGYFRCESALQPSKTSIHWFRMPQQG